MLEMYDSCFADIPIQEVDQVRLAATRLNKRRQLDLQRRFTRQVCARATIDAQLSFATNSSEEENQKQFSLVRLVCILHSVLVTLQIGGPGRYDERIIPVIPEMRRMSRR
jgi:hypothetical protein